MQIENCKSKIADLFDPAAGRDGIAGVKVTCSNCAPNLHFSICNLQFSILFFLALCALLLALSAPTRAQTVADKMVATVTNGARPTPDLITYSDLVWQLALEPGIPFSEKP